MANEDSECNGSREIALQVELLRRRAEQCAASVRYANKSVPSIKPWGLVLLDFLPRDPSGFIFSP